MFLNFPNFSEFFRIFLNFLVFFLVKKFLKFSQKPKTSRTNVCQSCEDDRAAYRYCHECEDWLCETCTAAHQRVKVTKNHTLTADNDRSETDRSFCEEHPTEELKLYCHQCRMLTCRDCQVGLQLIAFKNSKLKTLKKANFQIFCSLSIS